MSSPELNKKIEDWLRWDKNEKTIAEVKELVCNKKWNELKKIMMGRLSFGTAGLRSKMGAGFKCMNDLVVLQSAQGLVKNLQKYCRNRFDKTGVVIGYDGRHNSHRFAEITAAVFLYSGAPVYLFSTVTPTPFVPFNVQRLQLAAGIMVTASHNPKEDNGYKVYSWNSAQIISPEDKNILHEIDQNLEPWAGSWDTAILNKSTRIKDPLQDTLKSYMKILVNDIPEKYLEINKSSPMVFTYSAMHGVGYPSIQMAMDLIGIKIIPVVEQKDPDPNFTTVKFPNPEEGKSALELSIKTADANNSSVILANDPDADRLAVAEKNENGQWKIFNGNEIGALLGWWAITTYKESDSSADLSNVYMMSSTVSSKILKTMAAKIGFQFVETLTGFKWMGNVAYDLITKEKKTVLLAFEEAIGFMWKSAVLDKDGVSAAAQIATMAAFLNSNQSSLTKKLNEIWDEFGIHLSNNSYFISNDPSKTEDMFKRIRNFNGANTYPTGLIGDKYKIKSVRDLTTGYDDSQPDKKAILPVSCSSQMITFEFENGLVCTLRTSGTEPKVKYYTELCASPEIKDPAQVEATSKEMVDAIVKEWFEPQKNGFLPREG